MSRWLTGFKSWLLTLILLCLVGTTQAQPQDLSVTISVFQVENSAYPELTAYLSVFERTSLTPILDLGVNNFRAALDDETELTLEGFAPSSRPLDVITLLDVTGSVSADELNNQRAAVTTLAGDLNVQDQLGVFSMDSTAVAALVRLQSNPSQALGGLEALQIQPDSEGNVFWDGVYRGLEALQAGRPESKKVLIILTDLTEASAGGSRTQAEAITLAVEAGIQVYALHFDYEGDGLPVEGELLPSELTRLSDSTGGITWAVAGQNFGPNNYTDDTALPSMIQTVNRLMQSEFALRMTSPLPANGQRHNLNLTLTYQGTALPTLQTYFITGQPNVVLSFPSLNEGQNLSLPATVPVAAQVRTGALQTMQAVAISEAGQRISLGTIDPIALTLTIPEAAIPNGTYRLVVEASDDQGRTFEGGLLVNIVEGLSVTLVNPPTQADPGQTLTIQAQIGMAASVQSVQLLADGQVVAGQEMGPFDEVNLTWQAPSEGGEYTLSVLAQDILGNSARQEVTIQVQSGAGEAALWPWVGVIAVLSLLLLAGVWFIRHRANRPLVADGEAVPLIRASVPPPLPEQVINPPLPPVRGQTGPLSDPLPSTQTLAPAPMPLPSRPIPPGVAVAELRGDQGEVWYLVEGENSLGRHSQNSLQLRDESVSRQHAMISVQKRRCIFRDTGASHPSEINGQLLVQGQPYELRDGDRLRVGSTLLTFRKV